MSSPSLSDHLSYTADHEWIAIAPDAAIPGAAVRVGLSSAAVDALGDVVLVELPRPDTTVVADEVCGEVESTKSVSELLSPASGTVAAVNTALGDHPTLLNDDPYGAGWLFTVTVTDLGEWLGAAEYRARRPPTEP